MHEYWNATEMFWNILVADLSTVHYTEIWRRNFYGYYWEQWHQSPFLEKVLVSALFDFDNDRIWIFFANGFAEELILQETSPAENMAVGIL